MPSTTDLIVPELPHARLDQAGEDTDGIEEDIPRPKQTSRRLQWGSAFPDKELPAAPKFQERDAPREDYMALSWLKDRRVELHQLQLRHKAEMEQLERELEADAIARGCTLEDDLALSQPAEEPAPSKRLVTPVPQWRLDRSQVKAKKAPICQPLSREVQGGKSPRHRLSSSSGGGAFSSSSSSNISRAPCRERVDVHVVPASGRRLEAWAAVLFSESLRGPIEVTPRSRQSSRSLTPRRKPGQALGVSAPRTTPCEPVQPIRCGVRQSTPMRSSNSGPGCSVPMRGRSGLPRSVSPLPHPAAPSSTSSTSQLYLQRGQDRALDRELSQKSWGSTVTRISAPIRREASWEDSLRSGAGPGRFFNCEMKPPLRGSLAELTPSVS